MSCELCSVQVSSVASLNFGPSLGGVPLDSQHAEGAGTGVGAAEGHDSAGGPPAAVARVAMDDGGGTMKTVPVTASSTTDPEGSEVPAMRLADTVRFSAGYGEASPLADLSLDDTDASTHASDVAAGGPWGRGRGLGEMEQGQSMEKTTDDEGVGQTAEMRALFHQPTDLGTLAEADALKTLPMVPAQVGPARDAEETTVKERLASIGRQLDAFGRRGVLLGQYEMLGGDDRCQGGVTLQNSPRITPTH